MPATLSSVRRSFCTDRNGCVCYSDRHRSPPLKNTHRRYVVPAIVAACLALPAFAGTIRHDVPEQTYIDYGDTKRLVGGVSIFPSFGSGVAITRDWILTAAHVVAGVNEGTYVTFETDPDPNDPELQKPDGLPLSGYFLVDQVAIHEFYNDTLGPAGGFD